MFLLGSVLWLLIALTPMGSFLESSLLTHVLVEIPLLIFTGITAGRLITPHMSRVLNSISIPCVLLAGFTLVFWMIPRWLDASVNDEFVALMKYISVPLLIGIPLGLCWRNLHFIARGVVKIEFLAMLFRLGWIYLVAPDRLCNNYLLSEQQQLGNLLIILGLILGMIWLGQVFFNTSGYRPGQKLKGSGNA